MLLVFPPLCPYKVGILDKMGEWGVSIKYIHLLGDLFFYVHRVVKSCTESPSSTRKLKKVRIFYYIKTSLKPSILD
jgi:hypothetical protein